MSNELDIIINWRGIDSSWLGKDFIGWFFFVEAAKLN